MIEGHVSRRCPQSFVEIYQQLIAVTAPHADLLSTVLTIMGLEAERITFSALNGSNQIDFLHIGSFYTHLFGNHFNLGNRHVSLLNVELDRITILISVKSIAPVSRNASKQDIFFAI